MKHLSTTTAVRRVNALGLITGLLLGAGITPLPADVTIADYTGPGNFSYAVEFMPDIDQKRAFLPKNGSVHCAPTSIMNLFAYAANFGFPNLLPGAGLWSGAARHAEMTEYVRDLGVLMGTDDTGTHGGVFAGANQWLADSSMDEMAFVAFPKANGHWPVIDDGAYLAAGGAVVSFCYGRYEAEAGPNGIPLLTTRPQGHCVTLQRAVADSNLILGPREVRYRNPGSPDDGNLFSNSPYASADATTAENIEIARDLDGDGVFDIYPVTSLVNPPPDDGRYRIIDGFYALYPPGGMSYSEVEVAAQFANNKLGFVQDAQPVPFHLPSATRVLSVVPHPELHSGLALLEKVGGGKTLVRVPHARGSRPSTEAIPIATVPASSLTLVLGYGHSVFVVGQEQILHFETPAQTAQLIASVPLPREVVSTRIEAATYNHDTHEIIVMSGSGRRLFAIDPSTLRVKAGYVLTGSAPVQGVRSLVAWGGAQSRVVAALENGQVIQATYARPATGASNSIPIAFSRVLLPGVTNALSVDVDNGGRLYVGDKRVGLREYQPLTAAKWVRVARPLYSRFHLAGRKFAVFKNRTNLRPELHDTPEWDHIPADELIPLGPDIPDAIQGTRPGQAARKPDLTITKVTEAGNLATITMRNIGSANAPACVLRCYYWGGESWTLFRTIDIAPLAKGASTIKVAIDPKVTEFNNKYVVDAANVVVESNEINNTRETPGVL